MKSPATVLDPAAMTRLLRAGVLAMQPEALGLVTVDSVWGVMMELGYADAVASLVVLADGSVSIYVSDGSSVIGCGLHPDVRAAAVKLLRIAQVVPKFCRAAQEFPQPGDARVRFYLLTHQGVMVVEAGRDELDDGALELSELYYAGHSVIGMVELLGAGVELVDEMQLTGSQVLSGDTGPTGDSAAEQHIAQQETRTRGRACRILPYVGNVARRSHH